MNSCIYCLAYQNARFLQKSGVSFYPHFAGYLDQKGAYLYRLETRYQLFTNRLIAIEGSFSHHRTYPAYVGRFFNQKLQGRATTPQLTLQLI
ncbi:hypothetical protein [Spirosoma endbachense]|uniref:hypothetical protein n=1 Tax=Spirosoma endbachense TaxID=2666025 RepID=UPI0013917691|nr:hypothetical protein [Spirosoma endbachense]